MNTFRFAAYFLLVGVITTTCLSSVYADLSEICAGNITEDQEEIIEEECSDHTGLGSEICTGETSHGITFNGLPESSTKDIDKPVTFICATEPEACTTNWYFNGKLLDSNHMHDFIQFDQNQPKTLTVLQFSGPESYGNYTCTVSTFEDESSRSIQLKGPEKDPMCTMEFGRKPENANIKKGASHLIDCGVNNANSPKIEWHIHQNGQHTHIENNDVYRKVETGNLNIHYPQPKHTGTYICEIIDNDEDGNEICRKTSSAKITVT